MGIEDGKRKIVGLKAKSMGNLATGDKKQAITGLKAKSVFGDSVSSDKPKLRAKSINGIG